MWCGQALGQTRVKVKTPIFGVRVKTRVTGIGIGYRDRDEKRSNRLSERLREAG